MTGSLAVSVARARRTQVTGTWFRHASLRVGALSGSAAGGRWGPSGAFPVLYLGLPHDSVVAEAYRHLVDSVEGMQPELVAPRRLTVCSVSVTNVVDLRDPSDLRAVGLTDDELRSEPGRYERCQSVARVAHQLGVHGIVAPAATGLGETLALFTAHLPVDEMPTIDSSVVWEHLPADPRRLRAVDDQAG